MKTTNNKVEEIKNKLEKLKIKFIEGDLGGIRIATSETHPEGSFSMHTKGELLSYNTAVNDCIKIIEPYLNLDEDIEEVVLSDFLTWASKNAEPQFRVGEHEARIGWTGTNIVAKAMELFINRKASQPMSNKFIWGNV
jgi:hypothetical protein